MTQDDVLFGYRLQLFDLAARTTVSHACRVFGVHRSTYYRWKAAVERSGLEMLRPRERRRPQMPNQLSPVIEQRVVAFALGNPGLGPRRISAQLARPEWGGLVVSPNGVYKALCRHGLNTRAMRLALVAGYRARHEPPRTPVSEPHIDSGRPGELVGLDGRSPRSTPTAPSAGPIWLSVRHRGRPSSTPLRSPAGSPQSCSGPAGAWSACSPITATSSAAASLLAACPPASPTARSAPGARRPTGTSSAYTGPSSKSAGARPSPASCRSATAACAGTSTTTSTTTTTTAPTPDERRPVDARPTSSPVPTRWSRDEPHLSAQLGVCSD
jgi:transposase